MKTNLKTLLLVIPVAFLLFTSCESNDPEPLLATIDNVEVGLSNNETGVVGRDFHFNAEILAGDKIDMVQIKIEPKEGETYAGTWSYEIAWDEFKGVKNATVHKHFDIPDDAIEGNYDFSIVVSDENGTVLEEKRNITIILPENLAVDPAWFFMSVFNPENNRSVIRYNASAGVNVGTPDNTLYMNELLRAGTFINGVKGDGQLYVVLIKKELDHKPHTIDAIDYSKTIIWDIYKHTGIEEPTLFGNEDIVSERYPELVIGAEFDNNIPTANPISDVKAWEEGDYVLGFLYENTTYNMSLFQYFEVTLEN
ncbi:protein of unknown function [Zobellia uliginosa]|uniref:DUF4625 domain-containing protein n=1 Tax=Zobellia uliginosa TaxID=143224 RepID=A0ABY1KSJ6_9FLAO|nr:DUF4625 domain-containing protein [Zobellia uliginosa]SIS71028.1 protein of unknown function [Zobellia uliginosa]